MIGLTEKPFNMNFGSQILDLLFEMDDPGTRALLDDVIRNAVLQEQRVEMRDLIIDSNYEDNEVKIQIEYNLVGYEQTYIFSHILTPTR